VGERSPPVQTGSTHVVTSWDTSLQASEASHPARAPSVIGLRVWQRPSHTVPAYTFGGSCCSAFQSVDRRAVRLPESFRGGCSFGGRLNGSLPLVDWVQQTFSLGLK